MDRVLVTGADGFTGRHLCRSLHAAGFEVHALARQLPPAPLGAELRDAVHAWHAADLAQPDSLRAVLSQVTPQRVIHLAAISFVAHGDIHSIYQTNLIGTRNLLEAVAAAPIPAHTLLTSSANIYGNTSADILDESTLPAPANDYAVSKLAMEYMARLWRDKVPITLVRPFNYSGRGQSPNFVLPKLVDHIRRRASIIELGNLDVERDYSDVRMVADVYVRLIGLTSPPEGPLNVCSGIGYTLRELIDVACELGGHTPEVRVNPAFVRANEVKRLVGDPSALEAVIGPLRRYEIRDTLGWMLAP